MTQLEILEELQKITAYQDDGCTNEQLAKKFKCGRQKIQRLLRMARDAGRLTVGRRTIQRVDGVNGTVPVYKILGKGKKR